MTGYLSEVFLEFNETNSLCLGRMVSTLNSLYGINHITYLGINIPNQKDSQLVITTYKNDWGEHYANNNYKFIDPIISRGMQGILPLDWGIIPRKNKAIKTFFGEAAEFGIYENGLSVPIRGTNSEHALFSVNSDLIGEEWKRAKREIIADLTYCGYLFHSEVLRQNLPCGSADKPNLSPRELEVLKWASDGKTAWETSQILNLSQRTVSFYLKNTCSKLGVVNTVQAVSKSHIIGLLPL